MLFKDLFEKMAKWLRKLNANLFCSVRVPSNHIVFALLFGLILKWSGRWTLNAAIRV